ncbi:SCO family protein [Nocardioides guangzhouensis]|uniref:SCO family protein n=2 Tax=Nocardioides guangzhouensis TaxID=2497878 RepID=A0A4Q4ZAN8_9ACTN|nr:SCO family protein [Nocardioides guangzhouensis]
MSGTRIRDPFDAPATPLTDTDGAPYSLADDTDKPLTLLFFGYTHCPDICQMVMANITSALARLDESDRSRVDVVFVTTDPSRDDEKVLRSYLERFGDGMIGLTGDLDTIVGIGKAFGVYMEHEDKLATGGYDVSHSTNVFAIDANDQAPVTWGAQTSPATLAEDITTFLHQE